MIRHGLSALLVPVLVVGCNADQRSVNELRPAVVKDLPPDPADFQSKLLPGAPRIPDAAPIPAVRGSYPIGRAGNPPPPGPRVAPVQIPQELPAGTSTTTAGVPSTTTAATTATTSQPDAPTTATSPPAGDAPGAGEQERPATTTTTAPLLESEAIDP